MTIRVGINGLGRIGRCSLRAIYDHDYGDKIKVVAINSSHPLPDDVHLIKYDTTHGRFNAEVSCDEKNIYVNGDAIRMFADRNPANIPWGEEDVDVVFECTGKFKTKADCSLHIEGGARITGLSGTNSPFHRALHRRVNRLFRHTYVQDLIAHY